MPSNLADIKKDTLKKIATKANRNKEPNKDRDVCSSISGLNVCSKISYQYFSGIWMVFWIFLGTSK